MNSVSAQELSKMKFDYYELSPPWNKIVGKPEKNGSIMMFSPAGSGKSTVALQMCAEFTKHGDVLYVAAEEGISGKLQGKVERSGIAKSDIQFLDWEDIEDLKTYIKKNGIDVVCIDSYTVIDYRLKTFEEFRLWCRDNGVFFIVIVQQTKDGKFYGSSNAGFNVDCQIQVIDGKPSTLETGKNRFGELYSHDVDMREEPVDFEPPKKRKSKSPSNGNKQDTKKKERRKKSTSGKVKDSDSFDKEMSEVEAMLASI